MSNQLTEEQFLKDVVKHEMQVLRDEDVYRHLKFRSTEIGWNQWFEVVTWPGHLAYSGDMGTYVFSRLDDMFQFFRTDAREDGSLGINRSYWGEKLQAVDTGRHERAWHRQYVPDKFREVVREHVEEWLEDYRDKEKGWSADGLKTLHENLEEEVLNVADDGESLAREALNDFSCVIDGRKLEFHATWEWDFDDYTHRFTWCCYAIAWAIQKYDAR